MYGKLEHTLSQEPDDDRRSWLLTVRLQESAIETDKRKASQGQTGATISFGRAMIVDFISKYGSPGPRTPSAAAGCMDHATFLSPCSSDVSRTNSK